jgi:uncharacterized protein
MGQMLDALRQLHVIDLKIFEYKSRLRAKQQAFTQTEKRLFNLQAEAASKRESAQRQQVDSERVNLEVKTRDEHINKLRQALNTARTNKDYSTILSEINQLRTEAAKQEEIVLQGMLRAEELRKEEAELLIQCQQYENRLATLRQELAAEQAALEGVLTSLETERRSASASVNPSLLDRYTRISEYHEGDSMAEVALHGRGKSKTYVCGGCQMSIRTEQVNSLMTCDELQICDNCGRMLYLSVDLHNGHKSHSK